jgi:hypothetical protein
VTKNRIDWPVLVVLIAILVVLAGGTITVRAWLMDWDWKCAAQESCHAVHVQ